MNEIGIRTQHNNSIGTIINRNANFCYSSMKLSRSIKLVMKLLCYCFFLIPLTSSVHTLSSLPLTRILVVVIFFLLISYIVIKKTKVSSILFFLIYLFFVLIYSTAYSVSTIRENLEDFIYFSMAILVFIQSCDNEFCSLLKTEIGKRRNIFRFVILLTFAINFIAFVQKRGTFEATGAFKGYTIVSHSIATIFIYVMVIFLVCREKNVLWYAASIFFVFVSQARTFLIPAAVIICLYVFTNIKKKSNQFIVLLLIVVATIALFPMTSMYTKFITTNNQWQGLTNARVIFWKADMQSFKNDYSLFEMIFGKGFSWVRTINRGVTGSRIWAHNDFINVLLSTGVLGEVIYFGLIIRVIKQQKSIAFIVLLSIYILLPAFINGLYDYFSLVLSIMLLSNLDITSINKMGQHYV